ncbi:hypothetical protein K492DRAFT_240906 [Lichtheimia hyalospora FSU 10163]|nr:hypothetical protein K492DRAFT_240906 [Lichtheimia hyalospora FSU 10163]
MHFTITMLNKSICSIRVIVQNFVIHFSTKRPSQRAFDMCWRVFIPWITLSCTRTLIDTNGSLKQTIIHNFKHPYRTSSLYFMVCSVIDYHIAMMIAQGHSKDKPSSRTSMLACVVVVPLYLCLIGTAGYGKHRAILLCRMEEDLSNWEIWCYWIHFWIGMVSGTEGNYGANHHSVLRM